jgi:hypothetical protein
MSKQLIILSILIAILIVSCGGGAPAAPTVDPTEAVKSVAGEYSMQLTADDLKAAGVPETDWEGNLGTWAFSLGQDGSFSADRNGQFVANGNFGFNGSEMNIQVLHVCETCGCEGNIGRYSWAADDKQLVLKKIYDTCDSMAYMLTAKPLLRR